MTLMTPGQLDLIQPQVRPTSPPASRQGAAIKKATAKGDAALVEQALLATPAGLTAHQIDRGYAWASRSGSPAGKRLSQMIRLENPPVLRLKKMVDRCHVHVHASLYDPAIHGERQDP